MLALMIIYRCLASSLMVYMGVTVVDLKTLTDRWGKKYPTVACNASLVDDILSKNAFCGRWKQDLLSHSMGQELTGPNLEGPDRCIHLRIFVLICWVLFPP